MATKRQIQITFQEAMNQAKRLDECAEDINRQKERLKDIMGQLRNGWKGDASKQYLAKCEELMRKLNKTSGNLNRIARVVRSSARAYYDAEQRALAAVRNNGSSGGGGAIGSR